MTKKRTTLAKHETRKCSKRGCFKDAAPGRKLCCKHHKREWAKKNPLKYAYDNLRNRTRQRGLPFTITYDWYANFCITTGYAEGKGGKAESLTLDRIDPTRGYEPDNLQVLTRKDNSEKHHTDQAILRLDEGTNPIYHSEGPDVF